MRTPIAVVEKNSLKTTFYTNKQAFKLLERCILTLNILQIRILAYNDPVVGIA